MLINPTCSNWLNYTIHKVKKQSPSDTCLRVKLSVNPHTKRNRSNYCIQQFSLSLSNLLDLGAAKAVKGWMWAAACPSETAWLYANGISNDYQTLM